MFLRLFTFLLLSSYLFPGYVLQKWIIDPVVSHDQTIKDTILIVYTNRFTKQKILKEIQLQQKLKTKWATYFSNHFKYRFVRQEKFRNEYWRLPIQIINSNQVQFYIFYADGVILLDSVISIDNIHDYLLFNKYEICKKDYFDFSKTGKNSIFWKLQKLKSNL